MNAPDPSRLPDVLIVQMSRPPQPVVDAVGEQADWFQTALAPTGARLQVVRPHEGEPLPPPGRFGAAVVSGAWEMVTDRLDWSERTAAWLVDLVARDVPVLGVCYGHQLLAQALGGRVDYHPGGRETGTRTVELLPAARNDVIGELLAPSFPAHLSHLQAVIEAPAGATVLARSAHDPHQILRYGSTALSVQFHPEFDESVMLACLRAQAPALAREGLDAEALQRDVRATPGATDLLRRFATGRLSA